MMASVQVFQGNVFYFRKTILIPALAVILLSARHYQIASDCSGQVARDFVISKTSFCHKYVHYVEHLDFLDT